LLGMPNRRALLLRVRALAHTATLCLLLAAIIAPFSAGRLTPIQSALAQAEPKQVLRVGVYHNPPKVMLDEQARVRGILGDILQAIATEERWQLEAIGCEWNQCLDWLESGQIDILPDVAYSDRRAERFDFHQTPALLSWSQLYHRREQPLISLLDLNNKRLAVLHGSVQQTYLSNLASSFDLNIDWMVVEDLRDGFDAVATGAADAVAANHYFGNHHAYERGLFGSPIMFQPAQLFYASANSRQTRTLDIIDDYLNQWQADPDSPYHDILNKWSIPQNQRLVPEWVQWGVFALVVALLTTFGMSLFLRRQVRERTRNLRASEGRLATILNSVEAYIYIKGLDLRYQYANRKVCELLGVEYDDIQGARDDKFFDANTVQNIERNDRRVIERGERVVEEEINTVNASGDKRTFLSVKIPLRDAENKVYALCGISTDITEHQHIQNELHQLAYYDPLTGLANRRQMLEQLEHALAGKQKTGFEGAVVVIDIDGFKVFNDTVGHEQGDKLLQQVAHRISNALRNTDTAGRLGADDFMVVLEDLSTDHEQAIVDAREFAAQLQRILAEPYHLGAIRHVCSATVGVTVFSDTDSVEGLLKNADLAVTEAKTAGRGSLRFFNPRMQERISHRIKLESALRQAIEQKNLQLYLQPQSTREGAVIGMEALMRWQDDSLGQVSPAEFIPIAESSGLIIPLGEWLIEQACDILARWQKSPSLAEATLAINISPKQFRHPKFVPHILEQLKRTGIKPERLELEVTEGLLIDNLEDAIGRMNQLREHGLRFSLDDFGTGYSSLTYLKRLPLYQLKIDQSFVTEIVTNEHDEAIVRTIVALGHSLNLKVIAEGVETAAQAQRLTDIGVDRFQGFYYGKPKPAAAWFNLLADETNSDAKT